MRSAIIIFASISLLACTNSGVDPSSAGHTPRQERKAARIAAAQPAGPAQDCVDLNQIRSTEVLSDQVIDFHLRNGRVLRNTLPYACPNLGFEEGFSYNTSLSRLCSVDVITVLERAGGLRRGASCGLGKFQPVTFPDEE